MHQYLFTNETSNDKNNISKHSYHVPDIVLNGLLFYCSLSLKNPMSSYCHNFQSLVTKFNNLPKDTNTVSSQVEFEPRSA